MNSTCKTAIAAAVAGGYVLGRTRKAKMAFAVGTFLAGRRFGLTPAALAAEGLRQLRESPHLAELRGQIGGELLDAARAAASASADRRFAAFAETLRDRVKEDMGSGEPEDGADDEDRDADDQDTDDADDREPEPSGHGHGPDRERRKPPAKRAAAKKAAPPKKRAGAGRPRPEKKTAAKKTAAGRSPSTTSRRGR